MEQPGYEPLLDSKWVIPFVALLLFLVTIVISLLKIAIFLSRKTTARRTTKATPKSPAPIEVVLDDVSPDRASIASA